MNKQRPFAWPALSVLLLFVLAGCARPRATATVAGSTAFLPFAEELAELYMEKHPDVRINVQGGGSVVGIQAVREGAADIGMADLVVLPEDVVTTMFHVVVARDGIAVVVNPANRVNSITLAQARDIFSGAAADWKAVGGAPGAVSILSREDGSGTRKSFEKLVLKGARLSGASLFQDSNGTIRESVARNPGAVGYISIGFLDPSVKPLSLDGIAPTNENVLNGSYPLARPVFFLSRAAPTGAGREFTDFVLSPEGQAFIRDKGLIPVAAGTR